MFIDPLLGVDLVVYSALIGQMTQITNICWTYGRLLLAQVHAIFDCFCATTLIFMDKKFNISAPWSDPN